MSTIDNPSAFPYTVEVDFCQAETGMSLRDWFAGQAPVTLLDAVVCCGWSSFDDAGIGQDSVRSTVWAIMTLLRYEYADAMLAERAAKGGEA